MAANKAELSHRLKVLGADINTFWRPVRQKITDQMYDIALLQKFFKTWETSVKGGETNQEGYNGALNILPKDNPNTPYLNEAISEADLKQKFTFFFNKPLAPSNYADAPALEGQYGELQGKIRYYLAQQMTMDSNISAIQSEMDNLKSILKSDTSEGE